MYNYLSQNQLKLIWDIVKGEYEDINESYSGEIRDILNSLLCQVLC
jgi:hypothetical protein